jgi:hypothetical protein
MTALLHAVHHPSEVTASEALAWFTGHSTGQAVIGYLFAPDRAEWFRCDGAVPHGPRDARDLTAVFEFFATDGKHQLRWMHSRSGTGRAVSLAEDPGLLPVGTEVHADPAPTRLEGVAARLFAGLVTQSRDGWATLASARYAPSDVPVTASPGQEVWAGLAEYTVSDEHGNLSVADTLLLGLHPRDRRTPIATTERQL